MLMDIHFTLSLSLVSTILILVFLSQPSARPSPRQMLTRLPRTRSSRSCSHTTEPSLLRTPAAPSPRSSEDTELALVSRSPTVEEYGCRSWSFQIHRFVRNFVCVCVLLMRRVGGEEDAQSATKKTRMYLFESLLKVNAKKSESPASWITFGSG